MSPPSSPEPFRIEIPDASLKDLDRRLREWRRAADFANDDWRYGMNGEYLAELVDYWIEHFDWRAQEARMNAYEHFRVDIEGVPLHYMHLRGQGPDPVPLILNHGWPWTFWDFEKMLGPLSNPAAHGGDPADAFDLIVPSLPGFGFSSPLSTPGVGFARTAELFDQLMRKALGYQRYAAHGGDWGSLVTAAIGHLAPDHLYGVHEAMGGFLDLDYASIPAEDYAPEESDWPNRVLSRLRGTTSHMAVHTIDPQTLAFALEDSPAGLASWIVERRRSWSDCDGDVERAFSKDDLLTTVSIYWHTRTIASSMRFYWESMGPSTWKPVREMPPGALNVPTPSAFATFPEDNILVPRKTAERYANVQRWTVMPRGGHFSAAEEPELLTEDIRAFFRDLR